MAEEVTGTDVAVVPVSPLGAAAALDKSAIETMLAETPDMYWRTGNGDLTAAQIREHYADLIRAERAGKSDPLGPDYREDIDLPAGPGNYQLDGLPIYSAETRDLVDLALVHFHGAGFGQVRTREVLQWALTQPAGVTEAQFHEWAAGRRWSDAHIKYALEFYRAERKRQNVR
jgi:hypothetical protein